MVLTPLRALLLVGGLAIAGVNAQRVLAVRHDVPAYEELVQELESEPQAPGAPNAALDHARRGLAYLRIRDADRWSLGGYMLDGALFVTLGAVMVGAALRSRST